MLRRMPAIVTPQIIVNDCITAAEYTGFGRKELMGDLPLDHFGFCVTPGTYTDLVADFSSLLVRAFSVEVSPGGEATMGQQADLRGISWYYGNTIPALVLMSEQDLPQSAGGGYVAVRATNLQTPYHWLRRHDISFEPSSLYGREALRVPLATPDYGVGEGFYTLYVVTESLLETAQRLPAYDI